MKLPSQITGRNVVHPDEREQEIGARVTELETFSRDHEAIDKARRQLQDAIRRQRGAVKSHGA